MINLYERLKSFFVAPVKEMNPNPGKDFDYTLDDPAVPFKETVAIPALPNPCPLFTLVGDQNDPQNIQVYSNISFSLSFVQPSLIHPLNKWSSTNNLRVYARAGVQFNAYYDRSNLKFFYDKAADGSTVYTCESPDIVSHELGHAILDAIRPDLWSAQCLETAAFHEAFGDTMAMLSALQHKQLIQEALKETDNNISESNLISRLAEQMGKAINVITGGRAAGADALRNAVNNFMYVAPETLPYTTDEDSELGGECHSFSRVFVGAWYDALVNMYNIEIAAQLNPCAALIKVRDAMANIYLKCLPLAPLTPRFYASIANAMLVSAKNSYPKYEQAIRDAFVKRQILSADVKMLSGKSMADFNIDPTDTVWKFRGSMVVRKHVPATLKITSAHNMVVSTLENVEVDVANEHYLEFDNIGNLVNELSISQDVANEAALYAVRKLVATNNIEFADKIDNDKMHTKTHAVVNGKLYRLYFN